MANHIQEMMKQRARLQTRTQNLIEAFAQGIPFGRGEGAAVIGSAAVVTAAIELLSPVPTTVASVVLEAGACVLTACGVKSAIQGRHFWKAAIMGSDADAAVEAMQQEAEVEEDSALDSNLKPVKSRVTKWNRNQQETEEFLRQHGTDVLRVVK